MTSFDPLPGTVTAVFVSLADSSRRQVIGVLASMGPSSATAIAAELTVTRQAVAKHLATLDEAGLVESTKQGREVLFRLRGAPLELAAHWLHNAAGAWDDRLAELKRTAERM